jgi:hypothetical protein
VSDRDDRNANPPCGEETYDVGLVTVAHQHVDRQPAQVGGNLAHHGRQMRVSLLEFNAYKSVAEDVVHERLAPPTLRKEQHGVTAITIETPANSQDLMLWPAKERR